VARVFRVLQAGGHPMDLFEFVGARISQLRSEYHGGAGISQQALAVEIGVAANTISRWETATYHPSLEDLDK
jgi:DNA-binding XRE family transcriptional regulator